VAQERASLPAFTPFHVDPSISNVQEVLAALQREYPAEMKDAGIGGTVGVWFFIDEEARVQRVLVNASSRHKALDDAAVRVADIIEFTPALNRDRTTPVWISLPIEFIPGDGAAAGSSDPPPVAERTQGRVASTSSSTTPPAGGELGEVTGIARDAATGQPLPYVQLWVSGTERGTLSDQEGRFLISHVPVGDREVVADLIGFAQMSRVVTVRTESPAEVEFGLEPTAISFTKLVVRGNR
jgi:TonB family protein